jgi:hypothetical protein
MDDCAALEETLDIAQRVLAVLEKQAAGHTILSIPPNLKLERDEKREEVARLKAQLEAAQLAKKETQKSAQSEMNRQFPMRSRVSDRHYIEREEAKRLLERFALALNESEGQPLRMNLLLLKCFYPSSMRMTGGEN